MGQTTGQKVHKYRMKRNKLKVGRTFRRYNVKGLYTITEFETSGKYTLVNSNDEKGNGWTFELRNIQVIYD